MVLIARNGYLEEGYFSYKFVPLIGPEGYVVGSWAAVWETTRSKINDRRSRLLHAFNDQIAAAVDLKSLWERVLCSLTSESFDRDIPIAMIYVDHTLRDMDSSIRNETTKISRQTYHLEGQVGIPAGHAFAPCLLDASEDKHLLIPAFEEARRSHHPVILSEDNGTLPEGVLAVDSTTCPQTDKDK